MAKLIPSDFTNHYKLCISSAVKLQDKPKNYGIYYSCYLRFAFGQIKTKKEGNFFFFTNTLLACVPFHK